VAGAFALGGISIVLLGMPAGAQDAAKADAKHYKVEFENDQVRVLHIHYGPHEKGAMHSHPASVVVYLTDTQGRFTMPNGTTQDGSGKAGTVVWADPVTHQPENTSDKAFDVIQIELKPKGTAK
jgi:quercetin dioxygenase-like cupin family protein